MYSETYKFGLVVTMLCVLMLAGVLAVSAHVYAAQPTHEAEATVHVATVTDVEDATASINDKAYGSRRCYTATVTADVDGVPYTWNLETSDIDRIPQVGQHINVEILDGKIYNTLFSSDDLTGPERVTWNQRFMWVFGVGAALMFCGVIALGITAILT